MRLITITTKATLKISDRLLYLLSRQARLMRVSFVGYGKVGVLKKGVINVNKVQPATENPKFVV